MDISKIRKMLKDTKAENGGEGKAEILEDKPAPAVEDEGRVKKEAVEIKVPEIVEKTEIGKIDTITVSAEEENAVTAPVKELELLAFNVASEEYAVKLSDMQEIIRSQTITPIPRSPEYLKGVTFLRGQILPVIDLGKRLGIEWESGLLQKIIVLSASKAPLGILIGSGIDVLRCRENEVLPPPSTLDEIEIGLIEGVVNIKNRFISVLNINNLLKAER
ncbi:MAG: chemotaxis protein CheW [Nitrospirae bacterium]|nr:chemotaxis protein CheW [Nitrospirota bacterium]